MPAKTSLVSRIPRFFTRISFRLLIINVLLVFLPVAGFLYLDTYEKQLLIAQENAMVQQGRILSVALSACEFSAAGARRILEPLERRSESRLRVLDKEGYLLADSSVIFAEHEEAVKKELPARSSAGDEESGESDDSPSWVYNLVTLPVRLYREYLRPPHPESGREYSPPSYRQGEPFQGPEVKAALAGRYGATTRLTSGQQRSVTLYCAIPIRSGDEVIGAVLVSQSTYRIMQDLYEIRLMIFRIFLASVLATVVISFILSGTIARPLHRLRNQAEALLDRRGRLTGHFLPTKRPDEIGDLARSLLQLTTRLQKHLNFIESFAADLSHEFKNPLAAIRSAAEIALETENKDEQRHFLKMVRKDVARMERLLSEAREISRIDTETMAYARDQVDLTELLDHLVTGFRIRFKGLDFLLSTPGKAVMVYGTQERLAQVFENLLDNAAGFSPRGGRIEVSIMCNAGKAVVSIRDSGPGIDAENMELVFNRFFSYRPGQDSKNQHTGLGLSIVKAIVENYSGNVTAGNHPRGGGLFTLEFPLAEQVQGLRRTRKTDSL